MNCSADVSTLSFTLSPRTSDAGIGENAPVMRTLNCDSIGLFGVLLDENRNAVAEPVISADQGHVQLRVICTDEGAIIAKAVFRMLVGTENQPARPARGVGP